MNRFITTALIISAMLMVPLTLMQAGQGQHSGHHEKDSEAHSHEGMMGSDAGMHERMEQMKQTMNRIRNTDDPAERRELMQQHHQQMHQSMSSMCKMMRSGKKADGEDCCPMMDKDPEMRRQMMQEHMQLMEGMMEQMKAHMQADQHMHNAQ